MNPQEVKIVIIGTGNIATSIGNILFSKGFKIIQVLSRSLKGSNLAIKLNANLIHETKEIDSSANLILLCIPDDGLTKEFASTLPDSPLICHCSGSVGLDVLAEKPMNGVLYPLQTFTLGRTPNFTDIPVFIEASNSKSLELLHFVANEISEKVSVLDSKKRSIIHLAAVFASNFTNQMLVISEELVQETGLNFDILKPLVVETIEKANLVGAKNSQTGPAKRGDQKTINKHLEMLSENPDYQNIYKQISDLITKEHSI